MFNLLLKEFSFLVVVARGTSSPNAEDTNEVKAAIVGFYQFSEPENWTFHYWKLVNDWLNGLLFLDIMEENKQDQEALSKFSALAYGAMLGARHEGKISEAEFVLGEIQLLLFLKGNCQRIGLSLPSV